VIIIIIIIIIIIMIIIIMPVPVIIGSEWSVNGMANSDSDLLHPGRATGQ